MVLRLFKNQRRQITTLGTLKFTITYHLTSIPFLYSSSIDHTLFHYLSIQGPNLTCLINPMEF